MCALLKVLGVGDQMRTVVLADFSVFDYVTG
jgi:hypothetical protein